MNLHLVGGFLGSGKTTAIIAAAHRLLAAGRRVGVVTNDQGKYLVDTAFFQAGRLPTVEVTGGCFCCHYDDFEARLAELRASAMPDVIFAESVGSCADLVATVIKPFLNLRGADRQPASFSVFADVRLLRRRLLGQPLPFSDNVVYIFDQQMEEAGLLVLNKTDLLGPAALEELEYLAARRFPGKPLHRLSAKQQTGIEDWLALLDQGHARIPATPLDIDYQRYGAGEAELAWFDQELVLDLPVDRPGAAVAHLLRSIIRAIREAGWPIGHLKFCVNEAKISIVAADEDFPETEIPELTGPQARILVNARVQGPAEAVCAAITAAARSAGARQESVESFHPGFPRPTHRVLQ